MATGDRPVPFYVSTEQRALTDVERDLVRSLVERESPQYLAQIDELRVVGRCGCGACPTVFFQPAGPVGHDREVASYVGRDSAGGLTGVVLWQEAGRLSQLEFWSVDGHDPWTPPSVESLERL
jgi:hypothetical protein